MTAAAIYLREDTIAACSTAAGRGAVAIIRISGPQAIPALSSIFRGKTKPETWEPRRLFIGSIIDPASQEAVDKTLCVRFRAPHSYTGEDVAEIHCHGGDAVVRRIVALLYAQGVRPAETGEFTFRAVRNGKMDLAQAEGIAALIDSRTQLARSLSLRMVEGAMSADLHALKEAIVDAAVEVETFIEFPDDALEEQIGEDIGRQLCGIVDSVHQIQKRAVREQRFEQGVIVVLAGRPNVGKSSLFNKLLGRERAIVTPHPGTTRDSIEGTIELAGCPVTLIDTAGLRETREEIEAIGIERSKQALTTSHIILYVFEANQGLASEDRTLLETINKASNETTLILLANKSDLGAVAAEEKMDVEIIKTSAAKEGGISTLIARLEAKTKQFVPADGETAYMITARQDRILLECVEILERALEDHAIRAPYELMAEELRAALKCIAQLDGTGIEPDIMNTIFSRFCIGK